MERPAQAHPTICLNMIVRNEAHIVREVLDSVAPYIATWVIVDTGSDDGTQDVIRTHMAGLGIPGEIHERPWHDFGRNRSEALTLARGHGDYIWVIDADDLLVGTPNFNGLTADVYQLRYGPGITYWRRQLFRDGLPWRYEGVLHEYADCGVPFVEDSLAGPYYIESRRLGGRSLDPLKYAHDAQLLLAEVEREPDNQRSVFYLAQSYFDAGDFANAHRWYERRAEMGGFDEEVYYSLNRAAESMSHLGEPWPAVQDAYLRAWEFRRTRAEPLHHIAHHYRSNQRYELGYLFAERAAQIPMPTGDVLFVGSEVYAWRALDEQAVCASWTGRQAEAFALCRRLLARDDLPDDARQRIAGNRDHVAQNMIEAAVEYPREIARSLVAGSFDAEVTVTLVAGPDRTITEATLNSFLHCCLDVSRVGRVVVVDVGLSVQDRLDLLERYRFLDFHPGAPGTGLGDIRGLIGGRFWLHLCEGWRFFAPDLLIGRLTAVLEAEPEVFQVGINLNDAARLNGASAPESSVRRTDGAGRYLMTSSAISGPAMFDTARLDREANNYEALAAGQPAAMVLHTATLDEVLCVAQH